MNWHIPIRQREEHGNIGGFILRNAINHKGNINSRLYENAVSGWNTALEG